MKVKEYLKKYPLQTDAMTFIKAKAVKDEDTPFYHLEYRKLPNYWKKEIEQWNADEDFPTGLKSVFESIIMNDNSSTIEWASTIPSRNVKCLLIISEDDFELFRPSEKDRKSTIEYIDGIIQHNNA